MMKRLDLTTRMAVGLKALNHFGETHQTNKALEELFELAVELTQWKKDAAHPPAIIDEIADVLVMMMQMALLHGWNEVVDRIDFKITRLERRLGMKPSTENTTSVCRPCED